HDIAAKHPCCAGDEDLHSRRDIRPTGVGGRKAGCLRKWLSGSQKRRHLVSERRARRLPADLERPRDGLAGHPVGSRRGAQAVLARWELVASHAAREVELVVARLVLVGEAADYDEAGAGSAVAVARRRLAAALSLAAARGRL